MTRLPSSDVEALVVLLEDMSAADGPAPFTPPFLDRLADLVGCEYATYGMHEHADGAELEYVGCSAEEALEPWPEFVPACPVYVRSIRYKRAHAAEVVQLADVFPPRHGRRSFDCAVFEHAGVQDWLSAYLERPGRYDVCVEFHATRMFTGRQRVLVRALVPHLAARWRRARRALRLQAAIATLERGLDDTRGLVVLDEDGAVEFASPQAQRLLRDYCGPSNGALPEPVARWHANGRTRPLALRSEAGRLTVEASSSDQSTLIISAQSPDVAALTPRELAVMQRVADGLTNAEIARELWLEPSTVRKHLENVYRKLGVRSRTAALARIGLAWRRADDRAGAPER